MSVRTRRLTIVNLALPAALAAIVFVGLAGAPARAAGLAPSVEGESVSEVGAANATVSAQVDAHGESTTYRVEYGTGSVGEHSSSSQSVGAGESAVGVLVHLSELTPGSEYHFRVMATNASGTGEGSEMVFSTSASTGPSELVLPDKRVYELVSSPENEGEVYIPSTYSHPTEDYSSASLFRASANGEAVAFGSESSISGGSGSAGNGGGDQYLARRGPTGWMAGDIQPANYRESAYRSFSSDLSVAVLSTFHNSSPSHQSLTPGVPEDCYMIYSRLNTTPPGVNPFSALFSNATASGECGLPFYAGESANHSHIVFQDEAALAAGAEPAVGKSGSGEYCQDHCNLFDSVSGELHTVNVLPGGQADPNAVFGGPGETPGSNYAPDLSNVVSSDGSHVFWTDLNTNLMYVREDDASPAARTVQVSTGPARFWTATPDGRYVFYTEGETLWRFDVAGFDSSSKPEAEALAQAREELVGPGSGVQGVVGINETGEDGTYLYFVATESLAPGAEKRKCTTAEEDLEVGTETRAEEKQFQQERSEEEQGRLPAGRGCNLYLLRAGRPVKFIAALDAADNHIPQGNEIFGGDWQASLGYRTAEVTPSGESLVFSSQVARSLVGYNSSFVLFGKQTSEPEIFAYDATTGTLSCASCAPDGAAPPDISQVGEGGRNGTFLPVSSQTQYTTENETFVRRLISEDGSRVFFETDRALVAQDTNGVQDVYEWEREGVPDCPAQTPARSDRGCVSLLSGGSGTDWSWLVDASANGRDVFFTSRLQLVPRDDTEKMELYDARVDGGFPEVEHACTGAGCQGVPPAPPIFATPSSATFSGVGNFEPAGTPWKVRPKPKRKNVKCKKGFQKKSGKCVRRAKTHRPNGRSKRGSGK